MTEAELRSELVIWAKSLFERGLTSGSSGNISVRLDDGLLVTPTNSCLGFLRPDSLSKVATDGAHISGEAPTKELPLHLAYYAGRPSARAVVHLHSTYATALSCLSDTDPGDAIPAITPYVVMKVGRVPVLPYTPPGSSALAPSVTAHATDHAALLLQNHGPVVAGVSLAAAVFCAEELEAAARLAFMTRGLSARMLDAAAIAELNARFPPN